MPVIRVELFAGRSREQKANFAKAITDSFVDICGGTPDTVHIIFQDVQKQDWAISGNLVADADLLPTEKIKTA